MSKQHLRGFGRLVPRHRRMHICIQIHVNVHAHIYIYVHIQIHILYKNPELDLIESLKSQARFFPPSLLQAMPPDHPGSWSKLLLSGLHWGCMRSL